MGVHEGAGEEQRLYEENRSLLRELVVELE
jgi:hypothetical protein